MATYKALKQRIADLEAAAAPVQYDHKLAVESAMESGELDEYEAGLSMDLNKELEKILLEKLA